MALRYKTSIHLAGIHELGAYSLYNGSKVIITNGAI